MSSRPRHDTACAVAIMYIFCGTVCETAVMHISWHTVVYAECVAGWCSEEWSVTMLAYLALRLFIHFEGKEHAEMVDHTLI